MQDHANFSDQARLVLVLRNISNSKKKVFPHERSVVDFYYTIRIEADMLYLERF